MWPHGDPTAEPTLYDAHMEEVRSGPRRGAAGAHPVAEGGATAWDERMAELGARYPTAVLSLVAPDGFPFSLRVPISLDRSARRIRIGGGALGVPVQPGLACVTAHDHDPDLLWHRNFQVRGDLVEDDGGWALVPHKLVGGFRAAARVVRQALDDEREEGAPLPSDREARAGRARALTACGSSPRAPLRGKKK